MSARAQFARTAVDLVETEPDVALVYAEISGQYFAAAERDHPDRVINVGIREQLLVNVGAGLALVGIRPIVHTFGSFLAERAFEQIKLGFGHQDVDGVLVGSGGTVDMAAEGRTHQTIGDVALMDTVPGMQVHAPSTDAEVDAALRRAVTAGGRHYLRVVAQSNAESRTAPGLHVVRSGRQGTVLALGPVLDPVLAATAGRDVTVLYGHTVRPLDTGTLRATLTRPEVVVVEPWLAGTSAHLVSEALQDIPHRLLSVGVPRTDLRRYGTSAEHLAAYGLDAAGLRPSIDHFLGSATAA